MTIACTLAAGLAKFQPQRVSVLLFPPVSERDQAGVEELESQTTALLSFRDIAKGVFDAQVAFNLLAALWTGQPSPALRKRASRWRAMWRRYLGRPRSACLQFNWCKRPYFTGMRFSAQYAL